MHKMPSLHQNDVDFRTSIGKTTQQFQINPSLVEKDYWVTWCIHYLFALSPWKDHLGFKGGTCMAKAYGIIDRFSEDVDVLLDWRLLGYRQNEPMEPESRNKREQMKKDMDKRTKSYLVNDMLPIIRDDVARLLGPSFLVFISPQDPYSIQFDYPKKFTHDPSALSTVKLEIGPMSQWSQLSPQPIASMIDSVFPHLDIFTPLPVLSVSPERTFWDKISILQTISHWRDKDPERAIKPRNSRHYYDIYCMLNSPYQNGCLEQSNLFFDAMQFSDRFYRVTTFDSSAVELHNIQLNIPQSLMDDLIRDYNAMTGMLYGEKPTFNTVYSAVLKFQAILHGLEKGGEVENDNSFPRPRQPGLLITSPRNNKGNSKPDGR